jgi:hypothetical protein
MCGIDQDRQGVVGSARGRTDGYAPGHGTNATYVAGCVCKDCREHQQQRMARSRALSNRTGIRYLEEVTPAGDKEAPRAFGLLGLHRASS